ncbi:MAG: recombination mediator RecR [Candidatus Gracilibacteria bacterium]
MDFLPDSINDLIEELSRLPGIGPRSAQRLAFHIFKNPDAYVKSLGDSILNVKHGVKECETCFALTTESPCKICSGSSRDKSLLCVVESTLDMIALEKTCEFKGIYHVLQGRISPLDGVSPDDIRLDELFARLGVENSEIREVILALNPDLEGDTTALFIQQKLFALSGFNVTRIARGIPSGGHLEYTDDATLIRALQGRQRMC